jgi:hypothetical protein
VGVDRGAQHGGTQRNREAEKQRSRELKNKNKREQEREKEKGAMGNTTRPSEPFCFYPLCFSVSLLLWVPVTSAHRR